MEPLVRFGHQEILSPPSKKCCLSTKISIHQVPYIPIYIHMGGGIYNITIHRLLCLLASASIRSLDLQAA